MFKPFIALVIICLTTNYSFSQNLLIDKTISQNEEIEIPIEKETDRIIIHFQNMLDIESEAYWTAYVSDKEKPENEIGPKKYRTFKLSPKIEDQNEPIRNDKKEIVLNTNDSDKIILKVEKGKVHIQVKPYKKKI